MSNNYEKGEEISSVLFW